ncbi:MAG: SDR family NAD(P)-dependent oxidoreductase [Pseudomonadota bacterium]
MRALIIGDTGGIGSAVKRCIEAEPQWTEVIGLSRSQNGLDLARPETITEVLSRQEPPFHFVFVTTGVLDGAGQPPEKALRYLTAEAMAAQFTLNCIGPALILQQAIRLFPRNERTVFAALSARVGSIGDNRKGGWYSYRAAKAALNQVLHTGAIELSRTHRQSICVALHPGTVATRFTKDYQDRFDTVSPDQAAANLLAVIEGLSPADTGGFFDWSGAPIPW